MVELTVYTCITSGFDRLSVISGSRPRVKPGVRYVIYTDQVLRPEKSGSWQLRPLEWLHPTCPRRTARWHKVNAHNLLPDTLYSLWIDGSQECLTCMDPHRIAMSVNATTWLAAFKHPQRSCIYQELEACKRLGKDDPQVMQEQIDRYRAEGYPADNGLAETACVLRRHTELIREFNILWWSQIAKGSLRDQLSFNYTAWKLQLGIGKIKGCRDRSPYFKFHPHKRR